MGCKSFFITWNHEFPTINKQDHYTMKQDAFTSQTSHFGIQRFLSKIALYLQDNIFETIIF
jgi:hypothetical protein